MVKKISDKIFMENLQRCGYVVPKNVDEKFLINMRMLQGRFDNRMLSLTIAPTMACNFRCVYCFEQGHYGKTVMDEEIQELIVNFVKKRIQGVRQLKITWFGGEPLLGIPVIEKLSKRMIEVCERNDVNYSASIITNGFLLNKETADKLKECKINTAQVTVDGSKDTHDKRRPLVGGGGTYDIIMKNLSEVKDIINITLRINVDYDNIMDADRVIETLRKLGIEKLVRPHLGLVVPHNGSYHEEKCMTDESYSKQNLQFLKRNNLPIQNIYPVPRINYCGADFVNSWVIDDRGYLYKCWNDIGNDMMSFGNLKYGDFFLQSTNLIEQYSSFDPMTTDKCNECKMLPICLGGCPHSRLEGNIRCDQREHTLHEYLLECTKSMIGK